MSNKQFLAKIGVFALLGVNVGAYYMFWPHHDGGAKSEAKSPEGEKGHVQLLPSAPAKQPTPEKPKENPAGSLTNAVPLNIPAPPKLEAKELTPDELAAKLLEHIRKEKEGGTAPVTIVQPASKPLDETKPIIPVPPLFPAEQPKTLPKLDGEPIKPAAFDGVTSPLPTHGVWAFQTRKEKVGGQIMVLAKHRNGDEFSIGCQQFVVATDGSEAVASGGVVCIGAGMTVSCSSLKLALKASRLLFEEQVLMSPTAAPGSYMRFERVVWEFPVAEPKSALGAPK